MLGWVCSVIDHRRHRHVVNTSVTHLPAARVPLLCFYHMMEQKPHISFRSICTSNNQRVGSVGDNDWRSKRFCSSTVLCIRFMCQMVKTRMIRLRVSRRSKCTWLNCILYFPLILTGSPNECWLHTCYACIITTWRLGLGAPLVTRN